MTKIEYKAIQWWSRLSMNAQRAFSKKHLGSYYYDLIWDYSLAKHVSKKKYYSLRVEVYRKEVLKLN